MKPKRDWTDITNYAATLALVIVLVLTMVGLILVLADRFGGAQ